MSVIWSVATHAVGSIPVVGALLAIPIVVLNTLNRKVIPAGTRIASRGLEQTALAVNAVNQTRKVIRINFARNRRVVFNYVNIFSSF